MKDMQTKIVMIGILLSTGIMLRAQDNGGCEDCPAFNAGGKVEVRGVKERIIGDLSHNPHGSLFSWQCLSVQEFPHLQTAVLPYLYSWQSRCSNNHFRYISHARKMSN